MGNLGWLTPLGFLGLISIAVLILIYILKPNYQKRIISSTHVWKLSLKYRKKRLPISQLRNIIIIICQILILTTSALILAQPFLDAKGQEESIEKIIVLDASASMLAFQENNITRFETAVLEIKKITQDTITESEGHISIILAKASPEFIVMRTNELDEVIEKLDKLIEKNFSNEPKGCTLQVADIDRAMTLAEEQLMLYPSSDIIFFTAKQYEVSGRVDVRDLSKDIWNSAILNCNTFIEDNHYVFEVEVANYNAVRDMNLVINLRATGCNDENKSISATMIAECRNNRPELLRFDETVFEEGQQIFAFNRVYIFIEPMLADPNFKYDNEIYIYGGERPSISVLYVTPEPAPYIRAAINEISLSREYANFFDIRLRQTDLETYESGELEPADFYIFEHEMPMHIPLDGVVMLLNPDRAPQNSGLTFGDWIVKSSPYMDNFPLTASRTHPVLSYLNVDSLNVSRYQSVSGYTDYQPLINCSGEPVFLVKNQPQSKVIVMTFALQMSNIPLKLGAWPTVMSNLFSYYFPPTTRKNLFEIGDSVALNARGYDLVFNTPEETIEIDYLDYGKSQPLNVYGTYTINQKLLRTNPDTNNNNQRENLFVKVAASESDFSMVFDTFKIPKFPDNTIDINVYLLFFFAVALVSLIFLEVILHLKDQF